MRATVVVVFGFRDHRGGLVLLQAFEGPTEDDAKSAAETLIQKATDRGWTSEFVARFDSPETPEDQTSQAILDADEFIARVQSRLDVRTGYMSLE